MTTPRPGPITLAAFSDVPYILDSIWRWTVFRAFRLGRVSLSGSHEFSVKGTTPWAFFAFYVVISSFLVFGPTFTTLCASFGRQLADLVRIALAIAVGFLAIVMLGLLVVEICSRLAKRVALQVTQDQSRQQQDVGGPVKQKRTIVLGTAARERILGKVWKVLKTLPARVGAVVNTIRSLDGPTRTRVVIAFVLLLIGAGIAIVPFAAAGLTLTLTRYDPDVCGQPHDIGGGLAQVLTAWVVFLAGAQLWKCPDPKLALRQFLLISVIWIGATAFLWSVVAAPEAREATGGPYPQTFAILLGCLLAVAACAWLLARTLIAGVADESRKLFQSALRATELFDMTRSEPELTRMRIVAALVNGVVYHPIQLLLLPSLVAVMLPTRWLFPVVLAFLALAVMLLAHGSVARRWEELIKLVDRWFLSGTPLFVSILVIVLAVLRLVDVQYVSTILDAAPFGTIGLLILAAYTTLWFFEYWVNRWIVEALLDVLGAPAAGRSGYVSYDYQPSPGVRVVVCSTARILAIHGIGDLCAQGWFERTAPRTGERRYGHAFTFYRLTELFDRLAPGTEATNDIRRRVKVYFALVNLALVVAAGGLLYWQHLSDRPLAQHHVVDADDRAISNVAYSGDLRSLLLSQAKQRRSAIVVATSGGGTRAALYTATALEGIAKLARAGDIVLLSGVSGGGVAAAYFASDYDRLARPYQKSTSEWNAYKHVMTEPFIEDVLDGVGELRVAANVPLGQLLAESLDRRAFSRPINTFGQLRGPALILNASISGHPWPDSEILKDRVGVLRADDPCVTQSQPYSSLAGSRLIFTNLREVRAFPESPMIMPDVGLPYKVIRDPRVPLAAAAAVSANFPPVFSNARVRVAHQVSTNCVGYSYFATDGGATENLGLVSALYALRSVLTSWNIGHNNSGEEVEAPPQIDIVAIEASAISYDYTEDRGVGAATGGSKERINGALTGELISSINKQLNELCGPPLRLHYIPLPVAFRSRGGFGTHWMYANVIRISNPLVPKLGNRFDQWWDQVSGRTSYVFLDHQDINILWTSLFDKQANFCEKDLDRSEGVKQVSRWLCGQAPEWHIDDAKPDLQIDQWKKLVADFGKPVSRARRCNAKASQ